MCGEGGVEVRRWRFEQLRESFDVIERRKASSSFSRARENAHPGATRRTGQKKWNIDDPVGVNQQRRSLSSERQVGGDYVLRQHYQCLGVDEQ